MKPSSVKSKISKVIKKLGPMTRTAYKRTVTTTGNKLTGRANTVKVDTAFKQQPLYSALGTRRAFALNSDGTRNLKPSDYIFTFDADSISIADLISPSFVLVLKGGGEPDEVFEMLDYDVAELGGVVCAYSVYARGNRR